MDQQDSQRKQANQLFELACSKKDAELFAEAAARCLALEPADIGTAMISYQQAGKISLQNMNNDSEQTAAAATLFSQGAKLADPVCLHELGRMEPNKELAHAYFNLSDCFDHIRGEAGITPRMSRDKLETQMTPAEIAAAEEIAIAMWQQTEKHHTAQHGIYPSDNIERMLATEADGSDEDTIYRLSVYTAGNLGPFPRCTARAEGLLEIGVDKGNLECIAALGCYLSTGYGSIQPNSDQAHGLLTEAAEVGYPNAKVELAKLYANGTGCPLDPVKAYSLLKNALKTEWDAALPVNKRLVPEVDRKAKSLLAELEKSMSAKQLIAAVEMANTESA